MNLEFLKYYAEIQALMVQVEAMKIANVESDISGLPPKWRSDHFTMVQMELDQIVKSIGNLNDTGPR
jgi:hypothetical protein